MDEIARINSGELSPADAQHPTAKQYAAHLAQKGITPGPPRAHVDPNVVASAQASIGNGTISNPAPISPDIAVRTAQAQKQLAMQPRASETQDQFTQRVTSDPNLTMTDVEQAGAKPFTPPVMAGGTETDRAIKEWQAIQDARAKKAAFVKPTVGSNGTTGGRSNQYVNPDTAGFTPHAQTQAQVQQQLSTPIKISTGAEHLFGPGPTPTDDQGNPLPEGQVFDSGGMMFRNDARAGQATPVVFDAVKKDWVPRDSFLERKAQHDPNFNVKYRKAQSDLQSVVKSEALEPGTQFGDAMKQAQGALFDLARNATAVPEEVSLQQRMDQAAHAQDGSTWMDDGSGKLIKVSAAHHERQISPKEFSDFRTAAIDNVTARIPMKKVTDPTTKQVTESDTPERVPTAEEIDKEMRSLIDAYHEFAARTSQAMSQNGGGQGAAQSTSGGGGNEVTAVNPKTGARIFHRNGQWVDESGNPVE